MNNTSAGTQKTVTDISLVKEVSDKANNAVQNLKETAQSKFEQVGSKVETYKEKVSENLSGAAEKVHEKSDTTQEFLDKKAEDINEYAHQAIGKVNQFGHKAADILGNSSVYVKNFDLAEKGQNLKSEIKKKPGTTIAIAGVFGLLIGLLIGRSR